MASVGWKRVMWRVQALGAADEFRNALQLARSDALSRQRHSGVLLDPSGLRFLRFVDSSSSGAADGRYSAGETVIQDWRPLPTKMLVHAVYSSISAPVTLRSCGGAATTASGTAQAGTFSLVFAPDGRSLATFQAKLGISTFPKDTFRIEVLPPTGLITLER